MRLFKSISLSLILLIANYPAPSDASSLRHPIKKARTLAAKQTRKLARDLRLAFGGVLMPREEGDQKQVVYCKPRGGKTAAPDSSLRGNATSSRRPPAPSGTGQYGKPTPTPNIPSSPWKLRQAYSGKSFFKGWDFFTGSDPTHGIVDYTDQDDAWSSGLVSINDQGNAIMRVDTQQTVSNLRKSVRITTQFGFNGGLIIMDAVHMPTGCGSWPAFWTVGPNWPVAGEIDIVEGVHDYTNNQATIHTNPGCKLASDDSGYLDISGKVIGGVDCAALTTGNQGCGIRAQSNKSYGAAFNENGGGIYAMKWDSTGIAVYFFPPGSEPPDIAAEKPQPDNWGPAQARWPAASCDPFQYFNNHNAIFDTTLCGDWAGAVWSAAGIPGQEQSCAERTGFDSCEAFVRSTGSAFKEAYWEVRSVKIYQT